MTDKDKVIKVNHINPVDYFNSTKVQYIFDFMQTVKNVEQTGIDSLTYVKNKTDSAKRMITIVDENFVAHEPNGLEMEVGRKYTPFMMLQKFKFKNKFWLALHFVVHEIMNNEPEYIRVGTKYYKKTTKRDRNGIKRSELKLWEKQVIIDDYGKQLLDDIPRFDDFTLEPDNKFYRPVIGNNYNLFSKFDHEPVSKKEYDKKGELSFYWINTLIEHIFGEQYEYGIQYIKVLYDLPKQKLPILVLTSEERSTGKTTFVDLMEVIFGANSVVINPEDISNQFNGAYADKNVIMIEESRFESSQATEKLKNLATQKKILVNTKFIQHYSVPFHGHIIITSNDENKFSRVDNPEIRYWVRKVPSLEGKANHNILEDMTKEIPYFLHYLNTLPDVDTSKSRMVFNPEELTTEALLNVKKESLPSLHKDIAILLDEHCLNYCDIEAFYFTASDIKEKFFANNSRIEVNYINKILAQSMNLEKLKTQRYLPMQESAAGVGNKKNGRPFYFKNDYFEMREALKETDNY